jgi:hypothetical protein
MVPVRAVNRSPRRALIASPSELGVSPTHSREGTSMSKLLSVLVAAMFAVASLHAVAEEKKDAGDKKEMKAKGDKKAKKAVKATKAKKEMKKEQK